MIKQLFQSQFFQYHRNSLKAILIIVPASMVVGSLVALFLWLLEVATTTRINHSYLLYSLPLAGVIIALLYQFIDQKSAEGNKLILKTIDDPIKNKLSWKMTPLVLVSTVLTHLFGGSAGREGTAVQIGGSITSWFAKITRIKNDFLPIMLKAGMAAGFGSVFGTPFAGIIFAIEVTRFKSLTINSLLICFISSLTGDLTTRLWGIKHTLYAIQPLSDSKGILSALNIDSTLIYKVAIAGIAFGLASYLFIKLHSEFENLASRLISINWLKPIIGGLIIILLSYFFGSDYLGLGVVGQNKESISIVSAFQLGGAESFSWLLKLIFTAVTLSFGFKGGEVTPLFFIGATLGNTLAVALGVPIDLLAGLGFIAVFAGATKTPFTSTVMAIELFGIEYVIYFLLVNLIATYASGSHGIYSFSKTTK